MEHFSGSDHPTVYHGSGENGSPATPLPVAGSVETQVSEHVRALLGTPRMFALVRDDDEDGAEVVAYGLSLPGGDAATIGVRRPTFGYWTSAQSAARRLRSELIWLEGDGRLSTS